MKVFAYGSNINLNRIRARVPSARKINNAVLSGYQLQFNKKSNDGSSKATISSSADKEDRVWGVLYEIDQAEKSNLDVAEGLGKGYNELMLTLDVDGYKVQASAYVADQNFIDDELVPYDWYIDYILLGAKQNAFPEYYIEKLQKINSKKDLNIDRNKKNKFILNGEI